MRGAPGRVSLARPSQGMDMSDKKHRWRLLMVPHQSQTHPHAPCLARSVLSESRAATYGKLERNIPSNLGMTSKKPRSSKVSSGTTLKLQVGFYFLILVSRYV